MSKEITRRLVMGHFDRFAILPLAVFVVVLVFASCQDRDADKPNAEPAPEAAEQTDAKAPAAEAPSISPPPSEHPEAAPAPQPVPSTPTPTARPESPPPPAPAPSASAPKPVEPPSEPPPKLEIIEVTVPEGTVLELELLTALDTSVNQPGDEIQARTLSPVYVKGEPVLPKGTYLEGRVTEVQSSGRVKGRARLGFTFDRLSTRSGVKEVRTSYVEQEAESGKKKDAAVVGGGAGLGAIVGGIVGGKKGAAIGAAIGGAGGTGVVLATKGEEIRLPVGTGINVRLDDPVTVQLN
jgi:hypothetical protein